MTVSFCVLIYILAFFTISPVGLQMIFTSMTDFFAGALIPLPFFPAKLQTVMELLPFAAMQNVPLRIYSGSMSGHEMQKAVFLQIFWLTAMVMIGRQLCRNAERNLMILADRCPSRREDALSCGAKTCDCTRRLIV